MSTGGRYRSNLDFLHLTTSQHHTDFMKFARSYSSGPLGGAIPAKKLKYVPTSGTYPKGFQASGVIVGIKANNTTKPDLALLTSDRPCAAAAVFTTNKFQAAPVTFSRDVLRTKAN